MVYLILKKMIINNNIFLHTGILQDHTKTIYEYVNKNIYYKFSYDILY